MRWAALALVLAGCAVVDSPAAPRSVEAPAVPVAQDDTCAAAPYADLIGQPGTALERVLILRPIRILRPDTPVTQEIMARRINFVIDRDDRITRIFCG